MDYGGNNLTNDFEPLLKPQGFGASFIAADQCWASQAGIWWLGGAGSRSCGPGSDGEIRRGVIRRTRYPQKPVPIVVSDDRSVTIEMFRTRKSVKPKES